MVSQRNKYQKDRASIVKVQAAVKAKLARTQFVQVKQAAVKIQSLARGLRDRLAVKKIRAATTIQVRCFRSKLEFFCRHHLSR